MQNKKVLLIITGGIAAYKSLETIRELKKNNVDVTCILTKSGSCLLYTSDAADD